LERSARDGAVAVREKETPTKDEVKKKKKDKGRKKDPAEEKI